MAPGTAIFVIWSSDSIKWPSCQLLWLAPFRRPVQQLFVIEISDVSERNLFPHIHRNLDRFFGIHRLTPKRELDGAGHSTRRQSETQRGVRKAIDSDIWPAYI